MIRTPRRASRAAAMWLASGASLVLPRAAAAQAGPAPESTEGAAPPAGAPPAAAPTAAPSPVGPFGYGNPQSPNGTIGGGNATESSAHPVTGDSEDSFDLGSSAHGGGGNPGVARGDASGPIFIGRPAYSGELHDT
ncbi:MAG TPA: hypothetical protein VH137_03110, partial [Gemmatimonadales bacterium]|nr:hypothetical protein [Gemmatimonadales bacterium]